MNKKMKTLNLSFIIFLSISSSELLANQNLIYFHNFQTYKYSPTTFSGVNYSYNNSLNIALMDEFGDDSASFARGYSDKAQNNDDKKHGTAPKKDSNIDKSKSVPKTSGINNSSGNTENCNAKLAEAEKEFEAVNKRVVEGALANLQRVMWMTGKSIEIIDQYCPNAGKHAQYRKELVRAHDEAKVACDQLTSGGSCPGPNPY